MDNDNNELVIDGWTMRVRRPAGVGPFPVILLLHGWTGDENSMWMFASRLPRDALLIAPRALFPATSSGYSWHLPISKSWPWVDDFKNSVEKIYTIISQNYFPDGDFSNLHLIGFSQGAALAYSMAIIRPDRVTSIAGLSGFVPDGASTWLSAGRLHEMPVFVAHGTQDELVPVDKARLSVELLEQAGAVVTYCEDNVGHKLSAKCFHGLEAFYQKNNC